MGFTFNKAYIQKNICVNKDMPKNTCKGKCHLQKLMQNNDSDKNESTCLLNLPDYDLFFDIFNYDKIHVKYIKQFFKNINLKLPINQKKCHYPPWYKLFSC